MSEEPIDDIELEVEEPVDGFFLDVSLVEEVDSNSQEKTTAVVYVIRFSDVKPIWYGTVHLRFQRIKKTSLRCSIPNLSKVADPGHKAGEFSMK